MDTTSLRELCTATLGGEAVFFTFALGFALISRRPVRERLGLLRTRLPAASWLLAAVGTLALSIALDGVIEIAGLREGTPLEEFVRVLAGAGGADLVLALLSLGLVPGIAEELLCRGLVQRGFQARLGQFGAIVVAALFFGVLHVDPVHGGFAVVLGLYLGTLAAHADSIGPSIVCHASNNLLAVYFSARWPDLQPPGLVGIGLATAFSLACLWFACRPSPARSTLQVAAGSDDL